MEASDKIALAAFLVSLAAAGIALASLWRSHLALFRPIQTVGKLWHRIYTYESEGRRWHISSFDLPISVTNAGARLGQILGLRLRLRFPDLPISETYEVLPAKFEIPPGEARRIDADRSTWLKELPVTLWLPFTVLPGASITKHFIFETRWDEPVIQGIIVAEIEMRTSRDPRWRVIGKFETPLNERVWSQMVHGGSAFGTAPKGTVEQQAEIHPPDLHKYTGTRREISADEILAPSNLVPPKR